MAHERKVAYNTNAKSHALSIASCPDSCIHTQRDSHLTGILVLHGVAYIARSVLTHTHTFGTSSVASISELVKFLYLEAFG